MNRTSTPTDLLEEARMGTAPQSCTSKHEVGPLTAVLPDPTQT